MDTLELIEEVEHSAVLQSLLLFFLHVRNKVTYLLLLLWLNEGTKAIVKAFY